MLTNQATAMNDRARDAGSRCDITRIDQNQEECRIENRVGHHALVIRLSGDRGPFSDQPDAAV